jgi:hypothetical protein
MISSSNLSQVSHFKAFTSALYRSHEIRVTNSYYLSFEHKIKQLNPLNIDKEVDHVNSMIHDFIMAHITLNSPNYLKEAIDAFMECFFVMPYKCYEHYPPFSNGLTYYPSRLRANKDHYERFLESLIITNCHELKVMKSTLDQAFKKNPQLQENPEVIQAKHGFTTLVKNITSTVTSAGHHALLTPIIMDEEDQEDFNSLKDTFSEHGIQFSLDQHRVNLFLDAVKNNDLGVFKNYLNTHKNNPEAFNVRDPSGDTVNFGCSPGEFNYRTRLNLQRCGCQHAKPRSKCHSRSNSSRASSCCRFNRSSTRDFASP